MGDYTHYGTPLRELEDEEAPKRFQDDTVRDDRGRRRFHGAFTGGFSAGYFNSVGTKEGWTPQNFVSSRSKRANNTGGQHPEDFMDNEDFGEMGIAPQRVQLREGVRTQDGQDSIASSSGMYSQTAGVGSQRELLQAPLIRILTTDTESVGIQILRNMGWRPGRGLGPTVSLKATYGPQLPENVSETVEIGPEERADDIFQVLCAIGGGKNNVWGLGYSPTQRLNLFGERIDRERVTMSTATVEGRRVVMRGQAFGVGAFEEDDEDIYARDDMTQYDFEEVDHRTPIKGELSRRNESAMIGGVIDGFVIATVPEVGGSANQVYRDNVEIPPGWTPRTTMLAVAAKIMKNDLSNQLMGSSIEMSRDDKVALISDKIEGSVFNLISAEDKLRIEASKKAIDERNLALHSDKADSMEAARLVVPPAVQDEDIDDDNDTKTPFKDLQEEEQGSLSKVNIESLKPFASDPAKQKRFDLYIRFVELGHREMLPSIQLSTMSQSQAALEKKEFESALQLIRPRLGLSNRFEKKVMHPAEDGLLTGLQVSKDVAAIQSAISTSFQQQQSIRPLKDFGEATHGQVKWHPNALLCKRFNVPNPYMGDETITIPLTATSSRGEALASLAKSAEIDAQEPSTSTSVNTEKRKALPPKPISSAVLGSFSVKRFDDLIDEEEAKTPPPADLFKFIFSDDEDDDAENQNKDRENGNAAIGKKDTTTLMPSTSMHQSSSRNNSDETNDTSSKLATRDSALTKKNSGLFADLDLTLLNKRPPPKPIHPVVQPSHQTDDEELSLIPMGPKPPPVIRLERTTPINADSKRHHHHRSDSSRGEKRRKGVKKIKKEKRKKTKKKVSKKSKKFKKKSLASSKGTSRKRRRRERETDSSDQGSSSDGSNDSNTDESDSDEEVRLDEQFNERLREKLRKYKS
ncbi:G patch domain-containing protein 1-like [Varroa jacobsoni]|uniref:G patch domain-containing protein 1-like n=1 Tax=Varroa jacobsoni TaxID=62625 RepID=UPI000BF5F175|nr:G patch domain-containing protein 1-like [Varroa jacobsoni]